MYETITFNVDQRQNVWFFDLWDLGWRNHQKFPLYRKPYTMKMMGRINAHIAASFPRSSFEVAEYIMIYRLRSMSRDTWPTQWKFCQHIGGRASHKCNTPFAKSNGRFFSDTKINMMPSSNLYDFWWVHKMHASVHFLFKIYWLLALTRSAPGF